MPREWYDKHHAAMIEDPHTRRFYFDILADKKPYFMRYIYPELMKRYNTYIKRADRKARREYGLFISEMLTREPWELSTSQRDFLRYYHKRMPVGLGDCVMNTICRKVERAFDGYVGQKNSRTEFDYSIMKSGVEYSRAQQKAIMRIYEDYSHRLQDYAMFATRERVSNDEAISHSIMLQKEFKAQCDAACSNAQVQCEILLDICYKNGNTKKFVWDICGEEIINNLLRNNGGVIQYPALDEDGDIEFEGKRFSLQERMIGESE